jgi:glutamyl-tRNA reductase
MSVYNISVSHKTAPVEIRELLTFNTDEKKEFLQAAVKMNGIKECVLITTCNRTEIYLNGDEDSQEKIMRFLVKTKKLNYNKMLKYFLRYEGEKAVKHLFSVTSGLDSMLIGEDEILGQVKDDYQFALTHHTTDFLLNNLFRDAITCAKKIKTDTKISKTSISIGTLTANEVFRFNKPKEEGCKKVLIIGLSGKFGTIVMKNIYHDNNVEITGTIRTHHLDDELVMMYPKVKMIDYADRYDKMEEADIIISATASPHYTITFDDLEKCLDTRKPRLFIDLAVPMDIDKGITKLEGIELVDIDYFKQLSETNNQIKMQELKSAAAIIDEQVDEFYKWIQFRDFVPYIQDLKDVFEKESLESILYQMRNTATKQELEVLLQAFRKLLDMKQKPENTKQKQELEKQKPNQTKQKLELAK